MLGIFDRLSISKTSAPSALNDGRLDGSELRSIIEWTEQNLHTKSSLDAAARHIGNYFCEKFSRSVGSSYSVYVNMLRVSRACELIRRGRSTVEICEQCGFTNEPYYVKLFKRTMGMTPQQYRKEILHR